MNKNGFTLVEIMVVMLIIAILSTLSIFALRNARVQTRDAQRKSDLERICGVSGKYKIFRIWLFNGVGYPTLAR